MVVSDHVANGSFKSLKNNIKYFDSPNYALFLRNIDFKQQMRSNLRYIDEQSYKFLKKSHLSGGEVVISNVADVGSVHRVPKLNTPMVVGNNQIFLKSHEENKWLTDYLYVYFLSYWGQHSIQTITSGSAQQKFNKTDFRSLEIPILDKKYVKDIVTPVLKQQDQLFFENRYLSTLKATLLAKLF